MTSQPPPRPRTRAFRPSTDGKANGVSSNSAISSLPGTTPVDRHTRALHNSGCETDPPRADTEKPMLNTSLKETVVRLLPKVQSPAQYLGGELNAVVKDHRSVRGK